jgi:hypothetical protein
MDPEISGLSPSYYKTIAQETVQAMLSNSSSWPH